MKDRRIHVVHDALLTQVGDILVSFNYIERNLKEIAATLLLWDRTYPQMADIVTCELSFRQTCSLVISLALERFGQGANAKMFHSWVTRCLALEQKRNDVAHCTWGGSDLRHGIHHKVVRWKQTAKQKRGLHYVCEQVSEASLKSVADAIDKMSKELVLVNMELEEMIWPHLKGWSTRHVLEPPLSPFPTRLSPGIQPKNKANSS